MTQSDYRVLPIEADSDPRWTEFVAAHPDSLVYHHPAWLAVLHDAYGYTPRSLACFDRESRVRGILPLVASQGLLTGSRLTSLPRTPVAGPLSLDDDADIALVRAAVELARAERHARLELRLPSARLGASVAGTRAVPAEASYLLRLPADAGPLRFGSSRNHGRIKWAVNKAARSGVVVRRAQHAGELRQWYGLYLETMRDHARPPVPYRFFSAMWDALVPHGMMRLLLAEQRQGNARQLISGSIFLAFGETVIYSFNGRRRDALSLRPNDVIQWTAIHDAASEGYRRFDFGEVAEGHEGLAQFKTKWGAEETGPHRYVHPPSSGRTRLQRRTGGSRGRTRDIARWMWGRTPLAITAGLGQLVYRLG